MLVAPEQLTVENEARDAEDADLVGMFYDIVVVRLTIARKITLERRTVTARFRHRTGDRVCIVNVELSLPEAVENEIVILPEEAFSLGE